ncbi:MAG TPA: aspartate/glutamate racemase family protein, partial [Gemmatimonadaceae bacterium]
LARYGIETIVPNDDEREVVHRSIFEELGKNIFRDETKAWYLGLIESLAGRGAQGVILGCTEIPLIITQSDTSVPVLDTTAVHVDAAVKFALD